MLFEYDFNSHYLELSPGRLHYLDEGEGNTVVLVHGNPTWSYYYRNLIKILARHFRVIAPDHLGCGLSDKPGDYEYTLEHHIENLISLLEHLGVGQTSMVVHDWGGPIGLGAATADSIKLDRLVILNTAAFRATRIPLRIAMCRWPVFGKLLVQGMNGFARAAISMAVISKMGRETAQGYLHPYNSWGNRRAVYEFVKDIPLNPKHRSYPTLVRIEQSLKRIDDEGIPTAVYWGGQDFCFDDYFYNRWKHFLPQAEYRYFEEWGHYLLEDGKDQIEMIIDHFLSPEKNGPDE